MRNVALVRVGGGTRYTIRAKGVYWRMLSLYRVCPGKRRTLLARVRVDRPEGDGRPMLECVERVMGARLPSWKVMASLLAQLV